MQWDVLPSGTGWYWISVPTFSKEIRMGYYTQDSPFVKIHGPDGAMVRIGLVKHWLSIPVPQFLM